MPHLDEWLRTAEPVRRMIESAYGHLTNDTERTTAAAEENVLFALENLHSYPAVQRRLADGSLRLHGWFFKIASAELFAYDPEAMQFLPLSGEG
jgi:carbonic anhydrase